MRLAGKTALVTGAGQGIGKATAVAFAAEGAVVHATSRGEGPLGELASIPGITIRVMDVTSASEVAAAAAAVGDVDVLANVAGWVATGTVLESSEEDFDRSIDVNLRGTFRVIRAFLPGMLARGSGSIINVASVVSTITGAPDRAVYAASKGAVIALTKSVAADYAGRGIRCNALCPGTILTPSLEERMSNAADPAAARARFDARQPTGRLGTAAEIAAAAVFLASDESSFMTGQELVIDGGWSM